MSHTFLLFQKTTNWPVSIQQIIGQLVKKIQHKVFHI